MTKTLKELQEEHPCIEGVLKVFAAVGPEGCSVRERAFASLVTAKLEDEDKISELEDGCKRVAEEIGQACADECKKMLTAEQQAHAETRKQLDSMTVTMRAIVRMAGVEDADLRRIIRETAQATINRPTDNSPTEARGEGEK